MVVGLLVTDPAGEHELTPRGAARVCAAVVERARRDARGRASYDFDDPEAAQRQAQAWCDDAGVRWREGAE